MKTQKPEKMYTKEELKGKMKMEKILTETLANFLVEELDERFVLIENLKADEELINQKIVLYYNQKGFLLNNSENKMRFKKDGVNGYIQIHKIYSPKHNQLILAEDTLNFNK